MPRPRKGAFSQGPIRQALTAPLTALPWPEVRKEIPIHLTLLMFTCRLGLVLSMAAEVLVVRQEEAGDRFTEEAVAR